MASDHFDLFGDPLDFNGDGKVDIGEEFVGFMMFQEIMREEEESSSSSSTYYDYDDDDDRDYVTHPSSSYSSCTGSSRTASAANAVEYAPPAAQKPITPPSPEQAVSPEENYQNKKEAYRKTCADVVFGSLIAIIFGGLIIWGSFLIIDDVDGNWIIITFYLFVMFLVAFMLYKTLSVNSRSLSVSKQELEQARAAFLQTVPQSEVRKEDRKRVFRNLVLIVLAMTAVAGAVALVLRPSEKEIKYNEALSLMDEGKYSQAEYELAPLAIDHYKESYDLFMLCEAYLEYNRRDPTGAYYSLKHIHLSPALEKRFNVEELRANAQTGKEKQDTARYTQSHQYRVRSGVPYVGMSEKYIDHTTLGPHYGEIQRYHMSKDGQSFEIRRYEFYEDGNLIYFALCEDGAVTDVWDGRSKAAASSRPSDSDSGTAAGSTTGNGTAGSGSKHSGDTGPSTDGFYEAEDFYDWYRDDFVDLEEAEDYYYEHGGF